MNSGEILPEMWPLEPLWTSINLRSRCFINKISSSLDFINNDRTQVHCYDCIIKHFVCSTQQSIEFILLISVKTPTVLSRINTTSKSIKARFCSVYEQLKLISISLDDQEKSLFVWLVGLVLNDASTLVSH